MIKLNSSFISTGFPIINSNDISGGNMYFNNIEERDSLDTQFIKEGMLCFINDKTYKYLENKWIEVLILTKDQLDSILQRLNLIESGIKIENILLNSYSILLNKGETFKLEANLIPDTDIIKPIFISEDTSIADVNSEGVITAIDFGNVDILVNTPNPNIKTSCNVHVISSNKVGNEDIIEGPILKLTNNVFGEDKEYWKDDSGENLSAKLINFSDEPFKNNCLQLRGSEYLELPNTLMSGEENTIELYIDTLIDSFPGQKKLFAKKNDWNDMLYQFSNNEIMFGGTNGLEIINSINNLDGLNLFTFTINRNNKKISVYVNGEFKEEIILKESSFGENSLSNLIIGTNSTVDSSSYMDIYAIKIFDRILNEEEIYLEYENLKI